MPDDVTPDDGADSPDFKQLRKKAKDYDDVSAENLRLQRELAVHKAGLSLNEKQLRALVSSHEGEFEPDLLRATATDLGFVKVEDEEVPVEEVQAAQRVSQAAGGATSPAGNTAYAQLMEIDANKSLTPDEAMAQISAWAIANGVGTATETQPADFGS